ncbi:hypothetical protein WOLCODRAFT_17933 [Wolfiporia cocos MD-104 SS10]|uniref:Uncharacterized protein n=1 Tax=Wolfiporia cocos (strain MD-104) TaxID=742152 RepID=A0A2H3JKR0_WOLCO|nr:hypothetical protein WOLCODRAFT_17933 [Wolfiporia cocos MD-104 SS10]
MAEFPAAPALDKSCQWNIMGKGDLRKDVIMTEGVLKFLRIVTWCCGVWVTGNTLEDKACPRNVLGNDNMIWERELLSDMRNDVSADEIASIDAGTEGIHRHVLVEVPWNTVSEMDHPFKFVV